MSKSAAKQRPAGAFVWVIAGALIAGAAMQSGAGVLLGGVIGYLFAQVQYLRRTLDALIDRQQTVESDTQSSAAPATQARSSSREDTIAAPAPQAPGEAQDEQPDAGNAAGPSAASPATPPRWRGEWAPDRLLARYAEKTLAWLKGGNPLARVGIVVLFFGGAFLAKYSSDRGLLPIEARFIGLGLGALALVGLGGWLRERRPVFAQILQGGGIAGFYLTVFAATRLFELLPQGMALSLMVAIAIASAILAVAQDSLSLAFLGTVGGFLAPLLVSAGGGDHVALFSYYTVLNLGVFVIAWFRAWRLLNLAGFVLTFGVSGLFRVTAYDVAKLASTDFFLLLFFVLYVAISILFALRHKPELKGYVSGSLVFGLPVVVFTLQASLVASIEYALAWSALGFGGFYAALAWGLHLGRRENLQLLGEAFGALAVIFASLAIPLAFDTQTTTAMWAIEGAGLLWLGVRQQRLLARAFGALLQLTAGLGYLADWHHLTDTPVVLNTAYLGTLMLSAAGLASGYWLHRGHRRLTRYESVAATIAGLWALGWWLFGGLIEIERSFAPARDYGAVVLFGSATALLLHGLARRLAWALLDRAVGVVLPMTVLFGVTRATEFGHPSGELGSLAWPVLLAIGYFLLYQLEQARLSWFESVQPWPHAAGWWLLAVLLAWESAWQVDRQVAGVWSVLPWGLAPVLLVWIAGRRLAFWPLQAHPVGYRIFGAAPLAAFALLWVLAVNLTHNGVAGALPYLPLLNPLDISVAVVLSVTLHYWLSLQPPERARVWPLEPRFLWGGVTGLVFIWLTAALLRSLHHLMAVPWNMDVMADSFLVQTSLSVFWGLLGILTIIVAAVRGWRTAWLAGAALMTVVVVKLFLVDLTGTNTLARVVSFLTVGGLLLLAGFFAPLPPRKARAEPAR